MCYSFNASINSFVLIVSSFIAIMMKKERTKYDTWIAVFLLYVGFMQLIEALLWKNIDSKEDTSDITKVTTIYLIGQLVVNNYFAYVFKPELGVYSLTASVGLLVYYLTTMNRYTYDTTVGKSGHLVWNTYDKEGKNVFWFRSKYLIPILTLLWFLPFFIILKEKVVYFWPFIYLLGTYVYSAYKGMETSEMASNWCFFISFALFLLIFIPASYRIF